MNHLKRIALLSLIVPALACNFLTRSATPAPPANSPAETDPAAAPATSPPQSPSPVPTSSQPPEQPPPPAGLLEALQVRIDAGELTLEQGLIRGLQGLVGETQLSAALGESSTTEGTGLVLEARAYLQTGSDESAAAEIRRLLAILQPTGSQLEPFSQPEPDAAAGKLPGLASPAGDPAVDCVDLWVEGFPSNVQVLCFLYKQQTLGGYQARIYYPSWWAPNGIEWSYAQAAHDALADSFAVYQKFGQLRAINLVFTILPEAEATTLAMVPQSEAEGESCLILVYPAALAADQSYASGTPFGAFKQTIAHELFHCFQAVNFPDKFLSSPWSVQDWWGESTAEYFSNLVYPSVNFEWRWSGAFDSMAITTPIFNLAYENFVFFQFLANRIGDPGVIALIAGLPAGNSYAAQLASMSAYPDMQSLFHEFGQQYLDELIIDTSGAPIPSTLTGSIPSKGIGNNPQETVILSAQPFVLGVKQLIYLQEKIYSNAVTSGTVAGERSARPVEVQTGWLDELPEQVIAGCGVEAYRLLLTSTATSAAFYETTVVATVEEEIGCDLCLVGTWELNKASFEAHMESLMQNSDFGVNFIEGGWQFTFTPAGEFMGKFTNFLFNYTILTDDLVGGQIFTDVELTVDGESSGKYYVDGQGGLITSATGSTGGVEYQQKIWMNGDLIQEGDLMEGMGLFDPVTSSTGEYSCAENILSIRTPPLASPENTPIDYDRKGP